MSGLSDFAGAIPVVGGVISSIIGNAETSANNEANRQFQLEQQDKQNAYNQKMWQMQSDYNAPAAQVARLQAAGLNPNLVYGSGTAVGNNTSAPAPSARAEYVAQPKRAPDLGALTAEGLAAYNVQRSTTAQVDNLQASTTNAIADAVLKGVQAGLVAAQTSETGAKIPLLQSETSKNLVEANSLSALTPFNMDLLRANTDKAVADTAYTLDKNTREAVMQTTNIREAVARISAIAQNNAKSSAEIDEIKARTAQVLASKQITDLDINMRNQGLMPHDNLVMRTLGQLQNFILNKSHSRDIAAPGDTLIDTDGSKFVVPKR